MQTKNAWSGFAVTASQYASPLSISLYVSRSDFVWSSVTANWLLHSSGVFLPLHLSSIPFLSFPLLIFLRRSLISSPFLSPRVSFSCFTPPLSPSFYHLCLLLFVQCPHPYLFLPLFYLLFCFLLSASLSLVLSLLFSPPFPSFLSLFLPLIIFRLCKVQLGFGACGPQAWRQEDALSEYALLGSLCVTLYFFALLLYRSSGLLTFFLFFTPISVKSWSSCLPIGLPLWRSFASDITSVL